MNHPLVNIAVQAARDAGRVIVRYMNRMEGIAVAEKQRHDFVSQVDREAEEAIVRVIRRAHPDHAILAEEGGRSAGRRGSEVEWVVDPLDGTTNFLRDFPHFAISIGVREGGRPTQGVVYDPVREELFVASRGRGALLNDRRLRVNERKGLKDSLLATGFPFRERALLKHYMAMFEALFTEAADVRRAGSAALDLAYVAAGRVDGFWEFGLKAWDMTAGTVLIREAGGAVTDFTGGENFLERGDIAAGSIKLHRDLLATIRPHVPKDFGALPGGNP